MDGILTEQSRVESFLGAHPDHYDLLKPFKFGFVANYATEFVFANTNIYIYLLEANDFIKEQFGFEKEVLFAYSPYSHMESRSLQALYQALKIYPYKNRIDALSCFFVSDDANIIEWMRSGSIDNEIAQNIICFSKDELLANKNDAWYIRNRLIKDCFAADLFEYSLPLREDSFFFGRQQYISRMLDSIRRCENRGIFGLRKTGKTSLLFKVERTLIEQKMGLVLFIDCKSPSYRTKHWYELLGEICSKIANILKIEKYYWNKNPSGILGAFRYVVQEANKKGKKIILFFDEIEYISFNATLDKHWKREFIDFWQTIWSVQSLYRNLVFIIGGVNASSVEKDMLDTIQNPLFSIVQSEYLKGFNIDETKSMIKTIGKRMGLKFSYDAIEYLYNQYGGHPMLTRKACSAINRILTESRPIDISLQKIRELLEEVNSDLVYYFQHVVSEIRMFYPEEYELFEMLASGQIGDFIELAQISEYSKHLYDYGLVVKDNNVPSINMPVAGRYAALELAKREKRNGLFRTIEISKRNNWVKQRIGSIISDLRQLEIVIKSLGKASLFGANSFPEADRFRSITAVANETEFLEFINICNRCFVESIENYGKSIAKNRYFWTDIKPNYPAIFSILERIKVYRHWKDHSALRPDVAKKLQEFLEADTFGISIEEKPFVIQQKLLDGFFTNIQAEMSNLT
ncbi:hypothetical protein Sgly_1059 [Syntrophobotulus glycolicus DSM 8271]|uniref:ATP-binding protein n=1 Tax=Syntrophobotulus glycolicus (strain DSM 8271 / FlGlyR) TaxID=645991 RepID=F0STU7_SYNGF|nr:AAA-like domain-containing protein [Syntrophobotulus glycolicus]ADY55387.1 hypothetical protein Sgly_1059 [Syntrophobotulus glycolicus DSM 8271]